MENKIKVLVVDDSFLMRKIISDIINADPQLEVIGKAKDGQDALDKIASLSPDVVTLDMNLPVLDGLAVLEKIMVQKPTRVVMFSAYTRSGASATMNALELGAVDFIAKPSGEISLGLDKLKEEIISKIKSAAEVDIQKHLAACRPVHTLESGRKPGYIKKVVIIGASTGGPKAVMDIMQKFPHDLPAAFLIVQHMPKGFTLSFAERISWQSGLKAKEAEEGDELLAGKVFVAPAGFHMTVEQVGDRVLVRLNQDPLVNFVRPSIDVTMFSAAELFGRNTVGVILTGMGKDGMDGCRKIKEAGGTVVVQDEETSIVWGMPRSVCKAGLADAILPVGKLPGKIIDLINSN